MDANHCVQRAAVTLLLTVALVSGTETAVAEPPQEYLGRSLVEAIRLLQARGLRIVYSSATVTPELRVQVEPRSATPRQQLDELLAPHGLKARDGPGGTIQIVRQAPVTPPRAADDVGSIEGLVVDALTGAPLSDVAVRVDGGGRGTRSDADGQFLLRRVHAGTRTLLASTAGYPLVSQDVHLDAGATVSVTVRLPPAGGTHREYVAVSRPWPYRRDQGVASEMSLDRGQFGRMHGSLADDPVRAVHAFPRVTPVDEFRSEFAVRASPFRHVDFVVDGVSTEWLQHTAPSRGATGSLSMLGGQVLEAATLRAGAYPRRHGNRLGPELELTLREGERGRPAFRAAVGGTNAMFLGEGPLGGSERGSWLVALRQSLLEWPSDSEVSSRTAFGFTDGVAKLVYDVRQGQQLALSVLAGTSSIDSEDNLAPNEPGGGRNRTSVVNLSWRSTSGSTAFTQRLYAVRHGFVNEYPTGRDSDSGADGDVVYRADLVRPVAGGLLETGGRLGRAAVTEIPRSAATSAIAGSAWMQSAYLHFGWNVTPSFTLSPGLRVARSTLPTGHAVTPWVLGEWTFRRGWTLNGSIGVSRQLPEILHVLAAGSAELRPERARHVDLAIEHRLTSRIRWQATVFSRDEGDILREREVQPRLVGDLVLPPEGGRYANALQGRSRGIELLVDRRSATGLSGWAAYSFGKARYTDAARHESFWGDFDQRHAFSVFAAYRLSRSTGVGATFRAGSNFPIPGYFTARDGRLFVAARRNEVRLPAYVRLDVRADREVEYLGRRLTLFVEMLNMTNRANAGLASGSVDAVTGEATGFTDTLFRRRASAGILVEF
jgi:hypothetical protein